MGRVAEQRALLLERERLKHSVYISLGSNIGDREANLLAAIAALPKAGLRVIRQSSIYETEPVDFLDQPWFLNCVVEGETTLPPLELLRALRQIESQMGSKKLIAKGPRLIDLDILLYGEETIETFELQVPHPRMLLRRFVLVPLAEIAPDLKHPSWNATAAELLAQTPDRSVVARFPRSGTANPMSA
jgi:2-amino-4-hydroxy-6-hydroxymethyldihydropteridine diphosphokinase